MRAGRFDLDVAVAGWRRRLAEAGIDDGTADELEDHLREQVRELIERGTPERRALATATRRLGPPGTLGLELARAARATGSSTGPAGDPVKGNDTGGARRWLGELRQDLRHAARSLAWRPGFTLMAVAMLAFGIGATTGLYGVVDAVLLSPLPFPDADRLYLLDDAPATASSSLQSPEDTLDWAPRLPSFPGLALYHPFGGDANLTGDGGEPARIRVTEVSPGFFDVLGLPPGPGRGFLAGESRPGNNRVVVISRALWQSRYAGDPQVVGGVLELDGHPYTIVGVAPAGLEIPRRADAWTPLAFEGPWRIRGARFFEVLGRLDPSAGAGSAREDVRRFNDWLRRRFAGTSYGNRNVALVPLRDRLVGSVRMPLWVLMGAVALVLAVTCANLANLLLARARRRRRDLAVRAALGSSRGRLIRQSLLESLSPAVAGGLLGVGLARAGLAVFAARAVGTFPRLGEVALDGRVLAFSLGLTVATGLAVGVLPALGAARHDLHAALRGGPREGGARSRSRDALIVAQVALALVLVLGSGLLVRSYLAVLDVDPGFDPEGVLTFALALPDTDYPDPGDRAAFHERLRAALGDLPGVESVASSNYLPLGDDTAVGLFLRPQGAPETVRVPATFVVTGGAFFRTLGLRILQGSGLDGSEGTGAPPVIAINQAAARELGLGDRVVGQRVEVMGEDEPLEIVALVASTVHFGVESGADPQVYVPHAQSPWGQRWFLLRSDAPRDLAAAVRATVQELDPDLPVHDMATMDERLAADRARRRATTGLLAAFAAVTLLLAAAGLYGAASNWVARRTREIGVRLAVGASPARIRREFLSSALRLSATGLGVGLLAGLGAVRLLESLLFGVEPLDPASLVVALLLLVGITVAAVAHPAHRAAKLDPVRALAGE